MSFSLPFQIGEDDLSVTAEFPDDLAARAAGGRELVRVRDDGYGVKASLALGKRFEDGDALGANREAIARIFNIAAGIDFARFCADGGADAEFRKRRDCVFARAACCI